MNSTREGAGDADWAEDADRDGARLAPVDGDLVLDGAGDLDLTRLDLIDRLAPDGRFEVEQIRRVICRIGERPGFRFQDGLLHDRSPSSLWVPGSTESSGDGTRPGVPRIA
jgi:hypothetical protein